MLITKLDCGMTDSRDTRDDQRRDARGQNIPIPDPSDKTVRDIKEAMAQVSALLHAEMGGVQAVISEQFKSIDKRLSDRDVRDNLASASAKESVATALAAVVETSRGGNIRFDLLERRVAALELAISGQSGKLQGQTGLSSGALQVLGVIAAILSAAAAYYVATHK